ncbi:thioredoxin-dependent thiol peroxidase [Gorillibacterium sp. sgz5001074]|uniref:thioredoxin-dependent thiol peroxidase n=1 Tax=Gorillibacterium sp. sgz5001074 TaxID=3446695 RepID=UPI003F681457
MAQETALAVGQTVPDFTLASTSGQEVSLSGYRGRKVVLYFYPKDMTPACTQETCDFRDYHPGIQAAGAVILGISPDDLKSHGKFAAKHGLPFELLSDPEHQVSELFGVWKLKKLYGREYMGIERSTFLIDEGGKLVKEWRKVKVAGHAVEVLAAVKGD